MSSVELAADYANRMIEREARGPGDTENAMHHIEAVVGSPHHHNAWGAIICVAVKRGQIKPTGEWTKMRDVQSHARKTPVYRVAGRGA